MTESIKGVAPPWLVRVKFRFADAIDAPQAKPASVAPMLAMLRIIWPPDKALRLLVRVAEDGPPRNVQQNRKLDRDIWELKSDQTRLLYFTEGRRVIILTHGFLKKQQKLPRRELERARRLRDQYLSERQQ